MEGAAGGRDANLAAMGNGGFRSIPSVDQPIKDRAVPGA